MGEAAIFGRFNGQSLYVTPTNRKRGSRPFFLYQPDCALCTSFFQHPWRWSQLVWSCWGGTTTQTRSKLGQKNRRLHIAISNIHERCIPIALFASWHFCSRRREANLPGWTAKSVLAAPSPNWCSEQTTPSGGGCTSRSVCLDSKVIPTTLSGFHGL